VLAQHEVQALPELSALEMEQMGHVGGRKARQQQGRR
jgi:hypothetical protein